MKILLTSTSFQDTPGKHHSLLESQNFDLDILRGPLKEHELLPIIDQYDGIICSDDEYTRAVIEKGVKGKLKIISKYGVGLDQIDLEAAKEFGVTVTNCPGVNQVSVGEHVLALMLSFFRNIHLEYNITKSGGWKRFVGHEIRGKKIGFLGFGSVGKEAARICKVLGLEVKAYDKFMDTKYAKLNGIDVAMSLEALVTDIDILSLHLPSNKQTEGIINIDLLRSCNVTNLLLINTARADLVSFDTVKTCLDEGILIGYCTDVMEVEPMDPNHPLKDLDDVLITPHIGSRTYQSVERQGIMAIENLLINL